MPVLLDLTYLKGDEISGVANYAYRLLHGFKENSFDDILLLVTEKNVHLIANQNFGYEYIVMHLKTFGKFQHFNGLLNQRQLNNIIYKYKIYLFISPYIVFHGLYTNIIPSIGVFHDAQGFNLMGNTIKQFAYNIFTKYILRQYTKIVTISNFSKNDIVKKIPFVEPKLEVIYNSILPVATCSVNMIEGNKPYILNVNTLEPYKNLITLVKAFNSIKNKISHLLYIKAKKLPYWDDVILPYIRENGFENRVKLIDSRYSEEEMALLYRNASLFVSPSLMEGFGFTPIEAALYEVPVICSRESALYETTKGLLNYYEPATDENELANAILRLIDKPRDKKQLSFISHKYINCYSTKKQAEQFVRLIKTLI